MKRTYPLSQQYIAYVLFISFFLQSCGGISNQVIPQEKELISRTTLELSGNPLINTDKKFLTSDGYLVSFYGEGEVLKADLKANEKQPKPNYKGISVVVEEGSDLNGLSHLDRKTQKSRIQLEWPQSGQPKRLYILKGGLKGGMIGGESNKIPQLSERDRSKILAIKGLLNSITDEAIKESLWAAFENKQDEVSLHLKAIREALNQAASILNFEENNKNNQLNKVLLGDLIEKLFGFNGFDRENESVLSLDGTDFCLEYNLISAISRTNSLEEINNIQQDRAWQIKGDEGQEIEKGKEREGDLRAEKGGELKSYNFRNKPSKKKNESYTEDAYDKVKLQEDLDNLIEISSLIEATISSIDAIKITTATFTENLEKIGQLIYEISWREINPNCIRNKYGYRNRHKHKSNEKNPEGAKLNFEALAHLKDLDATQCDKLLNNNDELGLVRTSLEVIQQKINFILSKEYNHLTEKQCQKLPIGLEPNTDKSSHDEDEGFLKKVSSYYHDVRCINALIGFLNRVSVEDTVYSSLDLRNKVDRYWLGYLFVLIGETAKSISDYIRVEKEKDQMQNRIRFLFGKLGHHRQKIKGEPDIIYLTQEKRLTRIKNNFEEVRIELNEFLSIIKNILVEYAGNINNYHSITTELEKNNKYIDSLIDKLNLNSITKRQKSSKQELEHLENELRRLKIATEGLELKRKKLEEIKNQSSGSNSTINNPPADAQLELNKSIKQLENLLEKYLVLYPDASTKNISEIINISNDSITQNNLKKELTNQLNDIKNKLKRPKLSDPEIIELKKQQSIKTFELTKLRRQISLFNSLSNKELKEYLKGSDHEQDYFQSNLSDFLSLVRSKADSLTSKGLSKIEIKKAVDKISAQLIGIEKSIKKLEEDRKKTLDKIKEEKQVKIEEEEKQPQPKSESKQNTTLKKIIYELQNLEEIESSRETLKLEFARKMSIGFIGQYCKELIEKHETSNEIKKYLNHILKDCIEQTIHVRHKYIMHDSGREDDGKIQETSLEHLLPSHKYFDSLLKVTDGDNKDLIELSAAFMMLGQYDIAIEIIQECHKKMKSGEKLAKRNYDEFKPTTPEQEYTLQLYKLARTFLPKDFFDEVISHVERVAFKNKLLNQELHCQLAKGEFKKAIEIADEIIGIIEPMYYEMLAYPIQGLTIGRNNIASNLIDTEIQKYFSFQNLGQNKEAYQILQKLQDNFEKGVFSKTTHASKLTRIYRDLIKYEPTNKNKYFNEIESLLRHCKDKAIIEFQALLTKFEVCQDLNEMKEIINKLRECFQKNKAEFKKQKNAPFYNLEMELKLAELQAARFEIYEYDKKIIQSGTNISKNKKAQKSLKEEEQNILKEIKILLPKVQSQLKIYESRLLEIKLEIATHNGNQEAFKEIVEQLYPLKPDSDSIIKRASKVLNLSYSLKSENKKQFLIYANTIISELQYYHSASGISAKP